MPTSRVMFRRSVDQQIAVKRARTPTERFGALCELLDVATSFTTTCGKGAPTILL